MEQIIVTLRRRSGCTVRDCDCGGANREEENAAEEVCSRTGVGYSDTEERC